MGSATQLTRCCRQGFVSGCVSYDNDCCNDFFAGSGTTGHAVIHLNREDGGRRYLVYWGETRENPG